MRMRNRPAEFNIKENYIRRLSELYDNLIVTNGSLFNIPVRVIDAILPP